MAIQIKITTVDELKSFVDKYYYRLSIQQIEDVFQSCTGKTTWFDKDTTKEQILGFIEKWRSAIESGSNLPIWAKGIDPILKN